MIIWETVSHTESKSMFKICSVCADSSVNFYTLTVLVSEPNYKNLQFHSEQQDSPVPFTSQNIFSSCLSLCAPPCQLSHAPLCRRSSEFENLCLTEKQQSQVGTNQQA